MYIWNTLINNYMDCCHHERAEMFLIHAQSHREPGFVAQPALFFAPGRRKGKGKVKSEKEEVEKGAARSAGESF